MEEEASTLAIAAFPSPFFLQALDHFLLSLSNSPPALNRQQLQIRATTKCHKMSLKIPQMGSKMPQKMDTRDRELPEVGSMIGRATILCSWLQNVQQ